MHICRFLSFAVFFVFYVLPLQILAQSDREYPPGYWERQEKRQQQTYERQLRLDEQRRQQQDVERCNRARRDLAEDESKLPRECVINPACQTARNRCHGFISQASQGHTGGSLNQNQLRLLARECPGIAKTKYEDADDEYRDQLGDKKDVLKDLQELEKEIAETHQDAQKEMRERDEEIQEISEKMQEEAQKFNELVANPPQEVQSQVERFSQQILDATKRIRELSRKVQELKSEGVEQARIDYEKAIRGIYTQCDEQARRDVASFNQNLTARAERGAVVHDIKGLTQSRTTKLRERAAQSYELCRQSRTTLTALRDAHTEFASRQRALLREEQTIIDEIQHQQDQLKLAESQLRQAVERTDKAFDTAFRNHAQKLNAFQQQLHLQNQHKQQIQQNNSSTHIRLFQQIAQKRKDQQRLDYEEQATAVERHILKGASYFGENDADDQISHNQYLASRSSARTACCPTEAIGGSSGLRSFIENAIQDPGLCAGLAPPRRNGSSGTQ